MRQTSRVHADRQKSEHARCTAVGPRLESINHSQNRNGALADRSDGESGLIDEITAVLPRTGRAINTGIELGWHPGCLACR
jgi:hypothetical protein